MDSVSAGLDLPIQTSFSKQLSANVVQWYLQTELPLMVAHGDMEALVPSTEVLEFDPAALADISANFSASIESSAASVPASICSGSGGDAASVCSGSGASEVPPSTSRRARRPRRAAAQRRNRRRLAEENDEYNDDEEMMDRDAALEDEDGGEGFDELSFPGVASNNKSALDARWPEHLLTMPTGELNVWLKDSCMSNKEKEM